MREPRPSGSHTIDHPRAASVHRMRLHCVDGALARGVDEADPCDVELDHAGAGVDEAVDGIAQNGRASEVHVAGKVQRRAIIVRRQDETTYEGSLERTANGCFAETHLEYRRSFERTSCPPDLTQFDPPLQIEMRH
jgi:hypothetical protein